MVKFLKIHWQLLTIIAVGAFLRFYKLNFQSPWLDEIYTMRVTDPSIPFSNFISEVITKEGFPFLYFVLIRGLNFLIGYEVIVPRLFSAVFGVLAIWSTFKLTIELTGRKSTALIAALLIAFNDFSIFTSQDARPYSLYLFAVTLGFFTLVKFLKNATPKNTVTLGLSCALLLNSNFFSLINFAAIGLIFLFYWYLQVPRTRLVFFKKGLIVFSIAAILYVPNWPILIKMLNFESGWIPPPTQESYSLIFKELIGSSEILLFMISLIATYYFINIFKSDSKKNFCLNSILANKSIFTYTILAPWAVILLIATYVKSYTDTSVLIPRYFLSLIPIIVIIVSNGITQINSLLVRNSVLSVLIFFMFSHLVLAKRYYKNPIKTQFRESAHIVTSSSQKTDTIFTNRKYFYEYIFKDHKDIVLIETPSLNDVLNEMYADTTKIKDFWFITAHQTPFELSAEMKEFAQKRFFIDTSFDGLDAWARHFSIKQKKIVKTSLSDFNNYLDESESWVEEARIQDDKIIIKGWAYLKGIEATNSNIQIGLVLGQDVFILPTTNYTRNDITKAKGNGLNMDKSGFELSFERKILPNGPLKVAVVLVNSSKNKRSFSLKSSTINN